MLVQTSQILQQLSITSLSNFASITADTLTFLNFQDIFDVQIQKLQYLLNFQSFDAMAPYLCSTTVSSFVLELKLG